MSVSAAARHSILTEPARFYAYRVMPSGKTVRISPFQRHFFGAAGELWLHAYAKHHGWKIIVNDMAAGPHAAEPWRAQGQGCMRWGLSIEPQIHYAEFRPYHVHDYANHVDPQTADCTATIHEILFAVGCEDPSGNHFNGLGWTETIRTHSPRKPLDDLLPCDPIIYGPGDGTHGVIVFDAHPTDPIVYSHGQEDGPRLYRHSQELAAHGGYCTTHAAVHP